MTRRQLTDDQWKFIEPYLPIGEFGPYPERLREQFEGMIWRFRTSCQWREMPGEFDPWPTVYGPFPGVEGRRCLHRSVQQGSRGGGHRGHVGILVSVHPEHDVLGRGNRMVTGTGGFSLQGTSRTTEGARHEQWDAEALRRQTTVPSMTQPPPLTPV